MPRVLLVYDVPGWIWHRRCVALQKYAPADFQIDILPQCEWRKQYVGFYDATLWFDWANPPRGGIPPKCWTLIASEGPIHVHGQRTADLRAKLAEPGNDLQAARRILPAYHGVIAINPRVLDAIQRIHSRTVFLLPGVDVEEFRPLANSFNAPRPEFVVGWCGKAPQGRRWTPKGYDEVLLPLRRRLEDYPVRFLVNTNTHLSAYTGDEMCGWYNSLDVFLVTSCAEGTPSVLLEAAACGRAIISTEVGIAREVTDAGGGELTGQWFDLDGAGCIVDATERAIRSAMTRGNGAERGALARLAIEQKFDWRLLATRWLDTLANK